MNHCVSLSLTNRKTSVHLHAFNSSRTALRTFTSRGDQLVICGQYVTHAGVSVDNIPFVAHLRVGAFSGLGSQPWN
jgi:hypothetical protein